jgi:hypothetical protein
LGRKLLVERLFTRSAPMNRLAPSALQGESSCSGRTTPGQSGYLPEVANPRFDQICEDWLAILSRDMPIYDALEHLIASAGLNMLLYFLEWAKTHSRRRRSGRDGLRDRLRERTKVRALSGDILPGSTKLACGRWSPVESSPHGCPNGPRPLPATSDPEGECVKLMRERFQWPSVDGGRR